MSEAERTRRLHVANRLEELRAKHGRALEDEALPAWLDTLQGAREVQETRTPPETRTPAEKRPVIERTQKVIRVEIE